jgi:hypothetical protein
LKFAAKQEPKRPSVWCKTENGEFCTKTNPINFLIKKTN